MVKRICPKCNASFDRKSTFDKHNNKKYDCSQNMLKICRNLQEFAEICRNGKKDATFNKEDDMETKLSKNGLIIDINDYKQAINNITYSNLNYSNEVEHNNTQSQTEKNFECSYCLKIFSSKYTLSRHLNDNCKIKQKNDNEKENIFKVLLERDKRYTEEMEELKKQNKFLMDKLEKITNNQVMLRSRKNKISNSNNQTISNSILNSNNTHTQNNITIVNFGKEDLSIIDKKHYLERVIKKNITGVKIPDEILKIIHFNPLYPQLSNIYISDINRDKLMIFEDGTWKLTPTDKIPDIMNKIVDYSNEIQTDLKDKNPDNTKLNDRLGIVKKYTNMMDINYIGELDDNRENNLTEIERCVKFQNMAYNTIKTTLYNEGKNIKKK